jgi:uncharacterized repeat protein (TIGR03803 family)
MFHSQSALRLRELSVLTAVVTLICLTTLCAQASTFTTVYSFHSPEKHPTGGLLLASDGNFYGTTAFGGPYNSGTVIRLTPTGTIQRLATFNGTNGASPRSALVQAPDGSFYGTAVAGGTSGKGTIFRVTASGVLTSLYSFTGGADGSNPRSALVLGRDGNFYGTAFAGGAAGLGTAFRITPRGSFTLLHFFQSVGSDGSFPNGLTLGNDGNFYGTTYWGGPAFGGTVFQMTPSGALTLLYSFSGTSDGGNPDTALTLAKDGNFYGTTVGVGFRNFGTVFKISTAGALTTLYSFTGGSDGAYVAAPLVQASDGNFYGISSLGGGGADGTIFRMTPAGALTTLHQFYGHGVSGNVPGPFANLGALVQGSDGNFYGCVPQLLNAFLNPDDGAIFRLTATGTFTVLASFTALHGEAPVGVVLGQGGNLFGSDFDGGIRNEGTLFRLTPQGSLSTIVDFNGGNGMFPTPMIQGRDGDLYGGYEGTSAIPGGVFRRTQTGKLVWQVLFHGTNGASPAAALFQANDGNFYGTTIAGGSSLSGTVFRLTPSGALTSLYSFSGGVDGAAPLAPLIQDSQGNLYGTTYLGGTSGSGTVFKITKTGIFSSLYSFTGGPDGGSPQGLTLGDDGNLYGVTLAGGDNFAGTMFQITPDGVFTSLYSFSFFTGGAIPSSALVKGVNGTFYGATFVGGTFGYGSLYCVTTTGIPTTVYSFTGGADGGPPVSLSPGPGGSLLGTTSGTAINTADPGTVFEFVP